MTTGERLTAIRTRETHRRAAIATATAVGILAASVHWVGIVLGGAFVGLASKNLRWALLAGAGFGLVVWSGFLATMVLDGSLGAYLATGPIALLTFVIPIAGGVLGSLARGIV